MRWAYGFGFRQYIIIFAISRHTMVTRAKPRIMANCAGVIGGAPVLGVSLSRLVTGGMARAAMRKAKARAAHKSIILFDKGPRA